MSNTSISPKSVNEPTLLGLPLELRRQIYRELFIATSHSASSHWDSHHPHLREERHLRRYFCHCYVGIPPPSLDCSILFACRQVYEEALPILYEETTFYETHPYQNPWSWEHGDLSEKVPLKRLSELKHVRIEASLELDCEKGIADSIRLLLQQCPSLENLELQLLFLGWSSEYFDDYIKPDGALMELLSGLDLRNGLMLTIKDNGYVGMHVARKLRLNIAPEEMWHCNGWDYSFGGYYSVYWLQWGRAWSLGNSCGTNLRFLDEPSDEDIEQIIQYKRFWDTLVKRLQLHADIGLTRSLINRSIACWRRLWEQFSRIVARR